MKKSIRTVKRTMGLNIIRLGLALGPSPVQRMRSSFLFTVFVIQNSSAIPYTLSAHLSLALRDRGFLSFSSSEGVTGFFVRMRIVPSFSNLRKAYFTIRSSRE